MLDLPDDLEEAFKLAGKTKVTLLSELVANKILVAESDLQ